jgi:hypothetical protein
MPARLESSGLIGALSRSMSSSSGLISSTSGLISKLSRSIHWKGKGKEIREPGWSRATNGIVYGE